MESDRKSEGRRGHAGKVMSQIAIYFQTRIFVQRDPPLLPLISPSPTLSLSFIYFAGCTAKGFFATCKPSCFFRETNRKQIKRHICVCLYTEGHHYFSLPGWIQTPHAPPACPRCLKWTSMPWWLWWNLISRLQADCILLSSQCLFWSQWQRELKYPHAMEGYLGVHAWASGPQFPKSREGSTGAQEALLYFPPSFSIVPALSGAHSLVLIHDNAHTKTHLLLFTGQAGISFHPLACCTHPAKHIHMHTHTCIRTHSQVNSGLYWIPKCPLPSASPQPSSRWALFPTRSTSYLYYLAINRPLATT